ncbi:unnamed protein product, partial [Brassica oleracea]
VENISQGPYTIPPQIGYPTRDVAGGDPVVDAVETKSKGDDDGCSWRTCCDAFCCCFRCFSIFLLCNSS